MTSCSPFWTYFCMNQGDEHCQLIEYRPEGIIILKLNAVINDQIDLV